MNIHIMLLNHLHWKLGDYVMSSTLASTVPNQGYTARNVSAATLTYKSQNIQCRYRHFGTYWCRSENKTITQGIYRRNLRENQISLRIG